MFSKRISTPETYFINEIKTSCFQCLFPISGIIFVSRPCDSSTKGDLTRGKTQWEVFQGILGRAFSACDFTVGPCPSVSAGSAPGEAEGGNYLIDCKYLPRASAPAQLPRSGRAAAPGCSCCPNLGISAGWDESRPWKRWFLGGDSAGSWADAAVSPQGSSRGPGAELSPWRRPMCHGPEAARVK